MSFRTTYLLFGILGVVVVVFVLALWLAPVTPPNEKKVFPSAHDPTKEVKEKDIVRVEIHRGDRSLVFAREDGEKGPFRMEEPAGYRINENQVLSVVREVLNAEKIEETDLTDNLDQYGLKNPSDRVALKTENGRELTLYLGNSNARRVYVTSSDQPKTPMALTRSSIESVFSDINDFRARELLSANSADIKYLRVQEPKKGPVVLESRDGKWTFAKPNYGAADPEGAEGSDEGKAPTGVRSLLTAVTDFRVEDKPDDDKKGKEKEKDKTKEKKPSSGFVKDNASAEDLKKYGVENEETAELAIEVKTDLAKKSGQTLLVGKKVDDKSDLYYARMGDEKHVVLVAAKPIDTLKKFLDYPEKVRDHNLVRLSKSPDVMRIKYPSGEVVELIKTPDKDRAPHGGPFGASNPDRWLFYRGNDKKGLTTHAGAVDAVIQAVIAKRTIEDFPTNKTDAELGLKDPDLVVSLWTGGIKSEAKKEDEKKDDKKDSKKDDKKKEEKKEGDRPDLKSETPDVVLEFGRVDTNKLVAVRRKTGKDLKEILVVKVSAEKILNSAKRDPLEYLDRSMTPLLTVAEEQELMKITLDLDGKVTELVHKDPKDESKGWVFVRPPELKDRKAGSSEMNTLRSKLMGLRIEAWKSLKPSEGELSSWGLKGSSPTSGKITLTVKADGKDKEVYLLLGKQTDKKEYYAKRSDLDSVFLLSAAEVDQLKKPLLDLAVFKFAPSDVKSLKLTGWYRLGKPSVLELERKSASSWEAKSPAGVKVNADRAEKLLSALAELNAEKIVVFKGGAKEGHGFDFSKKALELEITFENKDKKKQTLRIGAKEGDNFYATSSEFPGDVFLIFKGIKGGIGGEENIFEKVKDDVEYLVTN